MRIPPCLRQAWDPVKEYVFRFKKKSGVPRLSSFFFAFLPYPICPSYLLDALNFSGSFSHQKNLYCLQMAACFYFMCSTLSEELPWGPTRRLGVGSLPQVWDGGGRGVSSRVRGQVFSIKTTSPVPSACQCLVICKAQRDAGSLSLSQGPSLHLRESMVLGAGADPSPLTQTWFKIFFFLIQESKMKIERKGRNFSWSWGPGRDARNVRISPVKTRGRTALRCPFSEPVSASVLQSFLPLLLLLVSLLTLSFHKTSLLSLRGKHGEYRHILIFSVQYPILFKVQQHCHELSISRTWLSTTLVTQITVSETSLTYFVFRVFPECTSKNSRVRAEESFIFNDIFT